MDDDFVPTFTPPKEVLTSGESCWKQPGETKSIDESDTWKKGKELIRVSDKESLGDGEELWVL